MEMRDLWRLTLIIKVLGKGVTYAALARRLKQIWNPKADFLLMDLERDFFIASFSSQEDYDYLLKNGPWMVQDHYLSIRKWHAKFDPDEAKIEKVAVWVRVPGLPVEYYSKIFFHRLGDRIGKTVRIDVNTQNCN
jgi:hypothetical protein